MGNTFLGWKPDPDPAWNSYKQPGAVFVWASAAFFLGYIAIYTIIKGLLSRQRRLTVASDLQEYSKETKGDDARLSFKAKNSTIGLTNAANLECTGYKNTIQGTIGFLCVWGFSLELLSLFILILIDEYWDCSATGIDDQCYYGTYPITGYSGSEYGDNFKKKGEGYWMFVIFLPFWIVWFIWHGLVLFFWPHIRNWFRSQCPLNEATHIFVFKRTNSEILVLYPSRIIKFSRVVLGYVKKMLQLGEGFSETLPVELMDSDNYGRMVTFQYQRYIVKDNKLWLPLVQVGTDLASIMNVDEVSPEQRSQRISLLGKNEIPYRVETFGELLVSEYATGFFFYQWVIYMWWFWWAYLFTALSVFSVVIFSSWINMWIKHNNQMNILKLTEFFSDEQIKEKGKWIKLDGKRVVPGDAIRVKTGQLIAADIILVEGNCIMNESGLTGESMPVSKTCLPRDEILLKTELNSKKATKHKLFAGTSVMQAGASEEEEVWGIVLKTGINTDKGELISHILAPFNIKFQYDEEMVVVFVLFIIMGCCGIVALQIIWEMNETSKHETIKMASMVFTVCQLLSPLLPLSLVVGAVASAGRLIREMDVFCVNPKRIAICGKIRLCCFDKTGTLTKEGLDFLGSVKRERNGSFGEPVTDTKDPMMLAGLSTCHACTQFKNKDGKTEYVGNQVEVKMFTSTGSKIIESGNDNVRIQLPRATGDDAIEIVRRFEFDHGRMTMSVVVKMDGKYYIFCKGASEKIAECCDPSSVSGEFIPLSQNYAKEGCYVLALASRELTMDLDAIKTMTRDEVESNLNLEGIILFRNELKPDTTEAIGQLQNGDTRVLMITGDNAQCGFYIARECGMLSKRKNGELFPVWFADVIGDGTEVGWTRMDINDSAEPCRTEDLPPTFVELAMTGKAYEILCLRDDFDKLLLRGRIFARFSPTQKTDVVEKFVAMGVVVGMCGDGGNDCGALRAAHAGLALSDAEASVVSPFTSKTKSVMSMVDLLREGRGAIATSFANYKFILIFGMSYMISKLCFVSYDAVLPSIAYIWIDIGIMLVMVFCLSLARPLKILGKERPSGSLFGWQTAGTIMGCSVVNWTFLTIALIHMENSPAYVAWPLKCQSGNDWWKMGDNWESGTIMCILLFQLVFAGFFMGFGARFRQGVWYNWALCLSTIAFFICLATAFLMDPNSWTEIHHFPSTNFNVPYSDSGVWATYNGYNQAIVDNCVADWSNHPDLFTPETPAPSTPSPTPDVAEPSYSPTLNPTSLPTIDTGLTNQPTAAPVASYKCGNWGTAEGGTLRPDLYNATHPSAADYEFLKTMTISKWCGPGSENRGYYESCRCSQMWRDCPCGKGVSPGDQDMTRKHRWALFTIMIANTICNFIFVALVMEGPGRAWWMKRHPDHLLNREDRVNFENFGVGTKTLPMTEMYSKGGVMPVTPEDEHRGQVI